MRPMEREADVFARCRKVKHKHNARICRDDSSRVVHSTRESIRREASIGRTKPRLGALRVRSMVLPAGVFASPEYNSNA